MIATHKQVTSAELRRLVETEKRDLVVLFAGGWCPDCRDFKPVWDGWVAVTSGPVFSVEVPRGGDEWKDWSLEEIPTVVAFRSGKESCRVHGTITRADLDKLKKNELSN